MRLNYILLCRAATDWFGMRVIRMGVAACGERNPSILLETKPKKVYSADSEN